MKQVFSCKIQHITSNTTKIIVARNKSPRNCIPAVLLAISVVSNVSATKKTNNNEDNKNKNHC